MNNQKELILDKIISKWTKIKVIIIRSVIALILICSFVGWVHIFSEIISAIIFPKIIIIERCPIITEDQI